MTDTYNGFRLETPETCEYEMDNMASLLVEENPERNPEVDINAILKEYKQYKTMQSEIEAHVKHLGDIVKTFMENKGVDTYYADQYKVIYKTVERQTVNTDLLKSKYPQVYNEVKNTIVTRPLKIF